MAAVGPHLREGQTTVGVRVEFDHLAPTGPGARVEACARITAVDGRLVTFAATVVEAGTTVARGTIVRAVVDRERFRRRLG